jgi:hypothetical protein
VFGGLVAYAGSSWASESSCTNQHASGQREIRAGHLKVGAEQLSACSLDTECPAVVRAECYAFLEDAQRLMPTVIFSIIGPDGKQVTAVKVFSNDELITERLDGTPIPLDPGKHRFRFVLPSGDVVSSDELIREGEKSRVIAVSSGADTEPVTPLLPMQRSVAPAPTFTRSTLTPVPVTPARQSTNARELPTSFWVASGVGAAGLVSFATFALLGRSVHADLAACSPDCGPSRHADFDALRRDYLLADVSLGIAAVSAGAAAYLYFTSPGQGTRVGVATRTLPTLHVAMLPPSTKSRPAMIAVTREF